MSARTILNPPLNTTLQELVNENPVFANVTATSIIYTDNILPITPSTTTTFSQNVNIGGNSNIGSIVANTSIQSPILYCSTIAPSPSQSISSFVSGSMEISIYGSNGNGIIASNTNATPIPAGGTALVFETFNSAGTVIPLSLGTTAINLGVPLFPLYTYPITNTSFIGYTNSVFISVFSVSSANTLYNIAQVAIPDTGLWMITGQCSFPVSGGNVLSINSVLNTVNQYCASSVSIGSAQVSNVFNFTTGTVVNLVSSMSSIGAISNVYLVYTRLA